MQYFINSLNNKEMKEYVHHMKVKTSLVFKASHTHNSTTTLETRDLEEDREGLELLRSKVKQKSPQNQNQLTLSPRVTNQCVTEKLNQLITFRITRKFCRHVFSVLYV